MPELPEVETIRQDLSKLIIGKTVTDITTNTPKMVKPSVEAVKKAVKGKKIVGMERRAKLLIFQLQTPPPALLREALRAGSSKLPTYLLFHLKLTGRLLFRDKKDPADDWQRVVISLSKGKELRFCDLRKFGWMKLVTSGQWLVISGEMGVEPFDKEFTVEYLGQIFSKTSRPVKIVLMDQKKIAGIGNIYANEALFLARVDPRRPAKKLRNKEVEKLRNSVLNVLKAGIKYHGASDQYYLDALGQKGKYQEHFLLYGRDGKKCFECGGEIKRMKLGGRGAFYCPNCQN